MTDPQGELLTLGPGREVVSTVQQSVLALLGAMTQYRYMLGREAWSDVAESDQQVERQLRLAEPAVRLLSNDEESLFATAQTQHAGVVTGRAAHPDGEVAVVVAPLEGQDGWALRAQTAGPDGSAAPVLVRCADEVVAKQIADEVLRAGPVSVLRLGTFAARSTERAAAAAEGLSEPEPARLDRAAAAVKTTWSDRPDLVTRLIMGRWVSGQPQAGNPAFAALAWHLAGLEERGYAMPDVLARLSVDHLTRGDVRNPAALAAYLVRTLAAQLPVVNVAAGPDSAGGRPGLGGHQQAAAEPVPDRVVDDRLRRELPPDVWERVWHSRGYPALRADLRRRTNTGEDVGGLLADLPADHIVRAHDPAGYLRSVLQRRAVGVATPRSRVDRAALADLVRRHVTSPETADRILACRTWPGLASRLAEWQAGGLPVAELLGDLPLDRLASARYPAGYARKLLADRVAALESTTSSDLGRTPGAANRRTPAPRSAASSAAGGGDGSERAAATPADAASTAARQDVTSPLPPDEVAHLDETSPIDRIGLAAEIEAGPPENDAELEERLRRGSAAARPDLVEVSGGEQVAPGRGGAHARSRAVTAAASDRAESPRRADPDGVADGRVDEHSAAVDRAAAEARGGFGAAVARAAAVLTAPGPPEAALRVDPGPVRPGPPRHARAVPTPRRRGR